MNSSVVSLIDYTNNTTHPDVIWPGDHIVYYCEPGFYQEIPEKTNHFVETCSPTTFTYNFTANPIPPCVSNSTCNGSSLLVPSALGPNWEYSHQDSSVPYLENGTVM